MSAARPPGIGVFAHIGGPLTAPQEHFDNVVQPAVHSITDKWITAMAETLVSHNVMQKSAIPTATFDDVRRMWERQKNAEHEAESQMAKVATLYMFQRGCWLCVHFSGV